MIAIHVRANPSTRNPLQYPGATYNSDSAPFPLVVGLLLIFHLDLLCTSHHHCPAVKMSTTAMPTPTLASSVLAQASVAPALTTVFAPTATSCLENRLTMMENQAYRIWMNEILPVPGSTFTDCYPSQFMTSYLLHAGGITQPAFTYLECPKSWSAVGPYTSNYIACCPKYVGKISPWNHTLTKLRLKWL